MTAKPEPDVQCPVPLFGAQGIRILRPDWALSGTKYKWAFGKARFDWALMAQKRAQSGRPVDNGYDMLIIDIGENFEWKRF